MTNEWLADDFIADVPIGEAGSLLGSVLTCLRCQQALGPVFDQVQADQIMQHHRDGAHWDQLGEVPKIKRHKDATTKPKPKPRNEGTCAVDDCERPARKKGWCEAHYQRWQTRGFVYGRIPIGEPLPADDEHTRPCAVENCDKPARDDSRWCKGHHERKKRYGNVFADIPLELPQRERRYTNRGATCSVENCDKPAFTRGWCASHYKRWQTFGDVQADKPIRHLARSAS